MSDETWRRALEEILRSRPFNHVVTLFRAVGQTGNALRCAVYPAETGTALRLEYERIGDVVRSRVFTAGDDSAIGEVALQWRAALVAKGFEVLCVQSGSTSLRSSEELRRTLREESGESMGNTLDHRRVGFQVIGFDWRCLYVNPAAAAHARCTVRELVGQTMMETYPGIESTAMFRLLERCMNDRVIEEFDNQFTFPSGESRWFDIRVEPVPEGICIYSIDIHERKLWQLEMEVTARRLGINRSGRRWRSFIGGEVVES
jgi:PAS domain-containing protein